MKGVGLPEIVAMGGVLLLFGITLAFAVWGLRARGERMLQRTILTQLGSGPEMAAFLLSPAGEKLLARTGAADSPQRSILKAVQRGVVTAMAGIGMAVCAAVTRDSDWLGMAAICICIGLGFLVSAYASYRLAGKLRPLGPR